MSEKKTYKETSEVIKFEDGIIDLPNYFPDQVVEVREKTTFRILGFIKANQRHLDNGVLRIPLKQTSHFGVKCSNEEDKFPQACWAKYKEFQVEKLYFNKGNQYYQIVLADFNDWKEIVEDREKEGDL